jgi:hypothetical protein
MVCENAREANINPYFSQGFGRFAYTRRCKRMWMQGLRPRTPEAYFMYVEESDGSAPFMHSINGEYAADAFVYAAAV